MNSELIQIIRDLIKIYDLDLNCLDEDFREHVESSIAYKFQIGDVVEVDMTPKLKGLTKRLMEGKGPDVAQVIDRNTPDPKHEPQYRLVPHPKQDLPEDYERWLYEKFLKPTKTTGR
jgi:hypothetical protein